jgi:peptide/nickel transport system ATP-binding protein
MDERVLIIEGIHKTFPSRSAFGKAAEARAVDGVDLAVRRGEVVGLVGESGCGKSTLGRLALGLLRPSAGRVLFKGQDLNTIGKAALRELRKDMQIIFQDPFASLNPRMRVRDIVAEPLVIHGLAVNGGRDDRTAALLEKVGLSADALPRYPHEFSGGQRQRSSLPMSRSRRSMSPFRPRSSTSWPICSRTWGFRSSSWPMT